MRIGDENMMIGKEMKMGCLILSKIEYRHAYDFNQDEDRRRKWDA